MKYLIFAITFAMFTGCGIYDRKSIVFTCIDERVYIDVYEAAYVSETEDIRTPKNITRSKSLLIMDDGSKVYCGKKASK